LKKRNGRDMNYALISLKINVFTLLKNDAHQMLTNFLQLFDCN
jgi:hypothetical protein